MMSGGRVGVRKRLCYCTPELEEVRDTVERKHQKWEKID